MSTKLDDIPKRPTTIVREAELNFSKSESNMMFKLLCDDGYICEHSTEGYYGIKYKGLIFLENGGYQLEYKIYCRKKLAAKISDFVDIIVKPIGILTALLISAWNIIKLLEFFDGIKSSIS